MDPMTGMGNVVTLKRPRKRHLRWPTEWFWKTVDIVSSFIGRLFQNINLTQCSITVEATTPSRLNAFLRTTRIWEWRIENPSTLSNTSTIDNRYTELFRIRNREHRGKCPADRFVFCTTPDTARKPKHRTERTTPISLSSRCTRWPYLLP